MKVCIYIDSKNFGGIETHIFQLIQGLLENTTYEVELLFWKNYYENSHIEHPLITKLKHSNSYVIQRCKFSTANGNLFSLMKAFQSGISVIHTHGYKAGITARLISIFTNTPIVSTYHNGDPGIGKTKLYNFLDKITSFLSLNIAVNRSISKSLTRCSIISNFVNTIKFENLESDYLDRKSIAFVGRLSHEKGPDIFSKLTKGIDHPISIYGDGPMMKALQNEFTHIDYKGMCDMEEHWKDIRVLVMTSRYEGLPLAALEAMARGIPVIASTAGALPELLEDCKVGKSIELQQSHLYRDEIEKVMQQDSHDYLNQGEKLISFIDQFYSRKQNIPKILFQYAVAIDVKNTN